MDEQPQIKAVPPTKQVSTLTARPRLKPSSNKKTNSIDRKPSQLVPKSADTQDDDTKNKTKRLTSLTKSKLNDNRKGKASESKDASAEARVQTSKGSKEIKKGVPSKPKPKMRKPREKMAENETCKSDCFTWKVIKILGSGGFGDVYKVVKDGDESDKKEYAMKTEMVIGEKRMLRLKVEVAVMMSCMEGKDRKHFIDLIDRGKTEKFKFVVMGLVGSSLDDYRRSRDVDFTPSTALQASIQSLEAIRDLHVCGWLHRDIKPQNFAYGLGEKESTVYVLDFGIAKRIYDKNMQIKKPRAKVKFLGTLRFASKACHFLVEQGRKDDMETWMYMMFDLFNRNKGLPWKKEPERGMVIERKERFFDKNYFDVYYGEINHILKEMWIIVDHINTCSYETEPNYEMMGEKLLAVAKEKRIDLTEKLDWVEKKKTSSNEKQIEKPEVSEGNQQQGSVDSGDEPDSKKKIGGKERRKKSNDLNVVPAPKEAAPKEMAPKEQAPKES